MDEFREQTEWERAVFCKLLEAPFPGRDALKVQLNRARVRTLDQEGSLDIEASDPQRAEVGGRVPVEADYVDADGFRIHFLLHVVEGIASELEIFKDGSNAIISLPPPEKLQLVCWSNDGAVVHKGE